MPTPSSPPARATLAQRACIAIVTSALALLTACGGGGDDDGAAQVRLVNLTQEVSSLDLYGNRDTAGDALRIGSVATDTASGFTAFQEGTWELGVRRVGSDAVLMSQTSRSLAADSRYSLVAYGYEGSYRSALLIEGEAAPSDGRAKLRVLNGASDAGSLDVYLTASDTLLTNASANFSSVGANSVSSFAEPTSGRWRLRITAAGDKDDVRLDVPEISLANQSVATLVITPGSGGVLVHGHLLTEGGALASAKNTSARVRVVASVDSLGLVDASAGGTALATALRSPSVGAYRLVNAASASLSFSVNGSSVAAPAFTPTAGADYTVLVTGTATSAQTTLLTDTNTRPATSGRAKVRLVNALGASAGNLTLSANYDVVANDIAASASSTPTLVTGDTSYLLQVTTPLSSTPLYIATDVTLASTNVYTVFMLSGQTSPTGTLRRER